MTDTDNSKPLKDLLAEQLPKDVPFTFYHYSTPPSKCAALFAAPPHKLPERTYCESHFLAASIIVKDLETSKLPHELLVLAIEVLIYTTKNLTTIFVSKADSTGCLSELKLPRAQSGSPLKAICGTFVSWLARERQRDGKKLVISLFARAQDQYLFPASIENKDKHVLDDRGLVKWWCKVLDPIILQHYEEKEPVPFMDRLLIDGTSLSYVQSLASKTTAKGHLVIPGFEKYDTLRYTPQPPTRNKAWRWVTTHPLTSIAPHTPAPPRCLVPRFPDDPKARFLDELDEELPDRGADTIEGATPSKNNGQWKSVKTLDQFWEFMTFRQECSSGRIVGFIWIVITPPQLSVQEEDENMASQRTDPQFNNQSHPTSPRRVKRGKRRTGNIRYGPIPLVLPRIKQSSSNLSSASNILNDSSSKLPPETSPYYHWPGSSRGTILFSARDYARAHEVLLQQAFSNSKTAARSTEKWKEEIGVLGGVQEWDWTVSGRKEATSTPMSAQKGTPATMVMNVRKKRKPDGSTTAETRKDQTAAVQNLSDSAVRKKPKTEPVPGAEDGASNGDDTLSAGMIRQRSQS